MNFRILATWVRPLGRVFALLAATALAASLLAPDGNAQTPAPAPAAPAAPKAKAKPKAAPKAAPAPTAQQEPAPAAGAPAAGAPAAAAPCGRVPTPDADPQLVHAPRAQNCRHIRTRPN